MKTSEDRLAQLLLRREMKRQSVKPWPEIGGLRHEPARPQQDTQEMRKMVVEIGKAASLLVASVVVFTGSIIAIAGIVWMAHQHLHNNLF
jgi:hypothetical protein